jgi:hypothetical protein
VVRFVGRTPVDGWWSRRLMRPDLRRKCAGEGRDGLVDLSPKEVAQVRILPRALTNPQVTALLF